MKSELYERCMSKQTWQTQLKTFFVRNIASVPWQAQRSKRLCKRGKTNFWERYPQDESPHPINIRPTAYPGEEGTWINTPGYTKQSIFVATYNYRNTAFRRYERIGFRVLHDVRGISQGL
jgi:hypothetical protein